MCCICVCLFFFPLLTKFCVGVNWEYRSSSFFYTCKWMLLMLYRYLCAMSPMMGRKNVYLRRAYVFVHCYLPCFVLSLPFLVRVRVCMRSSVWVFNIPVSKKKKNNNNSKTNQDPLKRLVAGMTVRKTRNHRKGYALSNSNFAQILCFGIRLSGHMGSIVESVNCTLSMFHHTWQLAAKLWFAIIWQKSLYAFIGWNIETRWKYQFAVILEQSLI